MVDTFYLHLEFKSKNKWSINLPFLCTKCGSCCTLDDFLTAGKIKNIKKHLEVDAKVELLFRELGKMWEADEVKYEEYITHNQCPFLVDNSCSIYEIRPEGCRLFPNTAFGMQTQNCEPLNRFKIMRAALKKGKTSKENYCFIRKTSSSAKCDDLIKQSKFTEKQYQTCISKMRQAGATNDEISLFDYVNRRTNS